MKTDHQKVIGKKLAAFRKAKGMAQKDLAKDICSPSSISQMENGVFVLSAKILHQLCNRLEIRIDELIEGYHWELEIPLLLEIVQIHLECSELEDALQMIEELEERTDLEDHQKYTLMQSKGVCLFRLGKTEESMKYLTDLINLLEGEREPDWHLLARAYNNLGNVYFFSPKITNRFAKAYANYLRAYQVSMKFHEVDDLAALIAYNLGKVCNQLRNSLDAQEFFKIAHQYYQTVSNPMNLANTMFEIGIAYQRQNDLATAEKCLNIAHTLYKSLNIIKMAHRVKRTIAELIWSITQPELAIQELLECVKIFKELGDTPREAYTYATLASVCLEQGKISDADSYLDAAMALIKENETEASPIVATIYRVRSQYFLRTERFEYSIEFSCKSADLFGKIGLDRESAESLELLVKAYRKLGKLEQALDASERAFGLLRKSVDTLIFNQGGVDQ